ncbi:MAG: retention module-containing protein, partial [Desulfobulbaceae bacterium]|nr:retention module-containing protein [Desulfobulbaceae bacterium]
MATNEHAADAATQSVGKVFIMYGTAKAVSPEGTERALGPNSPIFANDRIITGSDGSLSIVFDDPANSQLNLGRMSEIIIDEEVYDAQAADAADVAGEVAEIQKALLAEDFDPTTELEAPAAGLGGPATDGGGHPTVQFEETGGEVTPTSGADTTGVEGGFLDPLGGID